MSTQVRLEEFNKQHPEQGLNTEAMEGRTTDA
jgi:hypothetical protein